MNSPDQIPTHSRTEGEIAARRAYYPFFAVLLLCIAGISDKIVGEKVVDVTLRVITLGLVPPYWLILGLVHLPSALWVWALASAVSAWRKPSFRPCRVEASVFLLAGFFLCASIIFLIDFFLPMARGGALAD